MSKLLTALSIIAAVFIASSDVTANASTARSTDTIVIGTSQGPSVNRADISEGAGVIEQFRVEAPTGTSVKVTGAIQNVAGVTMSLPPAHQANAETCSHHDHSIVCTEAEEACPMPAATWHFQVQKLAGPTGAIRIEFLVASERSKRGSMTQPFSLGFARMESLPYIRPFLPAR